MLVRWEPAPHKIEKRLEVGNDGPSESEYLSGGVMAPRRALKSAEHLALSERKQVFKFIGGAYVRSPSTEETSVIRWPPGTTLRAHA